MGNSAWAFGCATGFWGTLSAALRPVLLGAAFVAASQPGFASPDLGGQGGDDPLSFHGITVYGTVDLGLQYETHGAPVSDYYVAGTASFVRPNSNHSVLGLTPSNLSQSKLGLEGHTELVPGWVGLFRLETFFNPQSGEISDGLRSLTLNNGRALADQQTGLDSSVAGQLFQTAYVGMSAEKWGSLTFGRQTTLLGDGVAKYDPQRISLAFSLIGAQGIAAGGGDTQDRRLNSLAKYMVKVGAFHAGADYKFSGSSGSANTAIQANVGADWAHASIDAYYSEIKDAVAASSLSASQQSMLPGLGFSSSDSLAATISDNTAYGLMALYRFGAPTLYAGYEHIRFENPATPLARGTIGLGGYILAFVNNGAYTNAREFQVFWVGARYSVRPNLDLAIAYYGYSQDSYATGAHAGCETQVSSGCSGTTYALSGSVDYHFVKRFDAYAGLMYSGVRDGQASGYLNTSTLATAAGIRFTF